MKRSAYLQLIRLNNRISLTNIAYNSHLYSIHTDAVFLVLRLVLFLFIDIINVLRLGTHNVILAIRALVLREGKQDNIIHVETELCTDDPLLFIVNHLAPYSIKTRFI